MHSGVGNVVQLLRWVVASQIIIGNKDLPFALMHSMAVHRALDTRASVVSWIVLTYKDFDGAEHA
jgi:hypothetical protein